VLVFHSILEENTTDCDSVLLQDLHQQKEKNFKANEVCKIKNIFGHVLQI
jgi:hypothetical protein